MRYSLSRLMFTFLLAMQISLLSAQSTIIQYLSGTGKDNTVNWDFYCTAGRNSGKWAKIPVPSCWELQGYGTYHYGWEENFKENESGRYRYNFNSESGWKGKRVRIVFEGSMTDTEVRINGKSAGEVHRGSFYRFSYDITSLLKGKNLLEVNVNKISADTSVNRAERKSDFWVFGGIFRPVYLEILPKQFIDWTAIDARADGAFRAVVHPLHLTDATSIDATIYTLDGKPVSESFGAPVSGNSQEVIIQTKVVDPALWNPESPNLYKVEIRLKNALGLIHTVWEKFGFRTVEFREGDGFYVNGTRIIFKGVNRHSFWPSSGRTTNREISELDVNLIKDMNMNSVRMSHYPPDEHFLDVCDSLGLFVLDELAGWQKKYDTPVGKKLVREMIMKDVNHPSIIVWDNGNEGGNNHELVEEYGKYDPQKRLVIHPWNIFNGTDTQHYKGYDCCAGSLYNGTHVFFPTEFLHGLHDGGHGAGLHDHWNLMMQNPLSAGLFLWALADEGIVRHDKDSIIDIKDNRAPDGIVGPYREKEGSYYTIREIWSPVFIKETITNADFDGTFIIRNDFLYTDLSTVKFTWSVERLRYTRGSQNRSDTIVHGNFMGPALPPGKYGQIQVPIPGNRNGDVLYLKAFDYTGREILSRSFRLFGIKKLNPLIVNGSAGSVTVDDSDSKVSVSASGVKVTIDKKTGTIMEVFSNGKKISLENGPELVTGTTKITGIRVSQKANTAVIDVLTTGALKKLTYRFSPDGILRMDYAYGLYQWGKENAFDLLGVTFQYPENKIKGVQYLGNGPYRVWKNRLRGGEFKVWTKNYNNTITGESWEYPEFKGYYSNFVWARIDNTESPFLVSTDTENLFLHLFTPQKPKWAGNDFTTPSFPAGNISFLHGISPIGTKFDHASNHGPQGEKNKVGPEWLTATVYFDFRPQ